MGSLHGAPVLADDTDAYPFVEQGSTDKLTVHDDTGTRLVLTVPMKRVAVFNRYTAEFIRAIAGTSAIVGVGADTARDHNYWPGLQASLIGQGQTSPNYEAIIALRPDAVFFPRNSEWEKARQVLAPFDIPVVVVTAWDLVKHEKNVSFLGQLFDQTGRAAQLNGFYLHYRDLLAQRTAGIAQKRVYFEEVGNYKTVLIGSGWHDMIASAGGRNIFGEVDGTLQPTSRGNIQSFDVDPEDVLARRPDIIVKLQPNQYLPHARAFCAGVLSAIADRPGFAALPAVQTGQVYSISYYLAGACSKIVGALQIAKWLYPDRFTEVNPDEAMRAWLEDFQGVPYPGRYWMSLAEMQQ